MTRCLGTVMAGGAFLAAACGDSAGKAGSAATRDSAGITIVENSGQAWPADKGWRVVDSPLVDVGGQGGDPASDVDRVIGPVLLSDGRLAIANGGTNEVRIYDAAGKKLAASGRAGSGPGEYQMPMGIWTGPGDSLLVFDAMAQRLTVLGSDAGVGRSFKLGGGSGITIGAGGKFDFAVPQGWFADGTVVGLSQSFMINQAREGIYRDSVTMIRFGPDGMLRDTLGRFPGTEMEQMKLTVGTRSFSSPTPVPLGRQSVSVVGKTRFYVAQNNRWEIEVRGLDGTLHTLIRANVRATPISEADAEANRKEQLEAMEALPAIKNLPPAIKNQVTVRVREAKYPAMLPFLGALRLDQEGNLWALEVARPGLKEERYALVDSTGRILGRVTLPKNFKATWIGSDRVYGVWKDADEVEHLRVYPLRKE